MKLTAEQTEDLPFPVGCPVWYNFPERKEGGGEPPLLKQGVVDSVSFDYASKDMVYEVVYDDGEGTKVVDQVSEGKLAYGAQCPVTIDPNGDKSTEGTVLLCEPSGEVNKIVYTVMMPLEGCRARYEEGVDATRIKYRRVKEDPKPALIETAAPPGAAVARKEQPTAADIDPAAGKSNSRGYTVGKNVPSSITCDAVSKGSHSKEGSGKRVRMGDTASQLSGDSKKPRLDSSPIGANESVHSKSESGRSSVPTSKDKTVKHGHDPKKLNIRVPAWLQRDTEASRDLYRYLVGPNREARRGVNSIAHERNCHIAVRFHASDPNSMVIEVDASSSRSYQKTLCGIHREITDLLLGYGDLNRDGARARLAYDIAVQCHGPHRPNGSTSKAVQIRNLFDGKFAYMSVVELSSEVYKGRREFHTSYLKGLVDRFWKGSQCYVRLCADGSCDPYILVTTGKGNHYQGVDDAVVTLKDAIRRHVETCVCALR